MIYDYNSRWEKEIKIAKKHFPYTSLNLTETEINKIKSLERNIDLSSQEIVDLFVHYLKIDRDDLDRVSEIHSLVNTVTDLIDLKLQIQQIVIKAYVDENFAQKPISSDWE